MIFAHREGLNCYTPEKQKSFEKNLLEKRWELAAELRRPQNRVTMGALQH